MLYIFHVDTGTMMTFDMNLALESVVSLKSMIEKVCKIPANKQVLLVSGGEVLRPDARVCSYSAGTDTNPIYMFSKTIIESDVPPKSHCDYGSDVDLKEQADKCLLMPPSYNTVVVCAQLAEQFWAAAREHTHACEKLVHDQHLQQQGWAAVVANMEDVTSDFHDRAEDFEEKFKEQISKKNEYIGFLSQFNDDLEILSSIPILPALRLNAASNPFTAFDELHGDSESYDDDNPSIKEEDEEERSCDSNLPAVDGQKAFDGSSSSKGAGGSTTSEGDEGVELSKDGQKTRKPGQGLVRTRSRQNNKEALTLLHWITVKENQESLKHIAEYCQKAMDLFDSSVMSSLRTDVAEALESAKQDKMKRIKGLEERLSGLEQLMSEARRKEQEQKELSFAFQQNKQSANSLTDIDVLRVVCESHRKQLQSMLRNHQQLYDMRCRCAKAKKELAINLYHRLRWIVYVENRMFEIDSKLMFYHRSLARLKRHLAVVGQLHRAPQLFCTAVHEIVRRRTFSQAFLSWASDLACHLLTIHNEEVMRRRSFDSLFSGHFLGGLFPGTEDMPPAFATQAPRGFDVELPRLTQNDIETLTARLPHLTPEIPPCDMTSVIQFFQLRPTLIKSGEQQVQKEKRPTVLKEAVGLDRGFESETDTEEFEKVGQSPIERGGGAVQLPAAPVRTDATPLTEENLGSKRSETENLKDLLSTVVMKYSETIDILKSELQTLKGDVSNHQDNLKDDCIKMSSLCEKHIAENALRERETLQRLTVDHELEMNDIKLIVNRKDEEILHLKAEFLSKQEEYNKLLSETNSEIAILKSKIQEFEKLNSEHAKIIEEAEVAKQKAIKELQEKMAIEYKGEMETLRSRFRLVALTSMDRSPSESSLEKIERTDMIEISNHKAILLQTKADFEQDKEEAIKEALENHDNEWKSKLFGEMEKLKQKYESEKQVNRKDTAKRIIEEKDRQLDSFRDREGTLLRECMKYKETFQQLADSETSHANKPLHMNASTNTDLKICKKMLKSHTPLGLIPRTLTLSSCDINDVVFVLWDGVHCNYTLLQESTTLYLLHSDCLSALDLRLNVRDESERRLYAVGQVENKEYCHAVKSGNKYQVAVSQRFYRVKVRPLKSTENVLKDRNYCCDNSSISKDLESSQSKSVMRMSMSEIGGSYDSTSRSRRDNPMTKSVLPLSTTTLAASPNERFPLLIDNPIIEDDNKLSSHMKSETLSKSSHGATVDLTMISSMSGGSADNRRHDTTSASIIQKGDKKEVFDPVEVSDVHTETILGFSVTTAESVPYECSNNECLNDALSSELVSEIAEEAAP